jgi:sucrose phosphorylase
VKNQPQLIVYVDRLPGRTFRDLQRLLEGPLKDAFGGVHVLPFFHRIDGADAGFDPIDHTRVDSRLGSWDDVAALAGVTEVMADVIVNHVSIESPQFKDFHERGAASPYAGMFLTYSRVFGDGASESDLLALHLIRADLPFTQHRNARGEQVLLWTTFTPEQIDIDVRHPEGRQYLDSVLARFHASGITAIRLDAVGFAIKKAGTSCFMIPETLAFIGDFTARARALGMDVLVEVHGHYEDQIDLARKVDWVYDFALPPLVLHTLYTRNATHLKRWIEIRPRNSITVLDTHDGIGVRDVGPDEGRGRTSALLPAHDVQALVETMHQRNRGESLQASGAAASNVDVHHINCTFYDALGRRDDEYVVARAIQCFLPGIPQVYYVGLLAGANDMELLKRTGVGRDVNRHYYTDDDMQRDLNRPAVGALLELLRFRNSHPAFAGTFSLAPSTPETLVVRWEHGDEWARLEVDLNQMRALITSGQPCSIRLPWPAEAAERRTWQADPYEEQA